MLIRLEQLRDFGLTAEQTLTERRAWQIPMDAHRRDDELTVMLDIPGADPGSVDLTVEKDLLTIHATRTWSGTADDEVQIAERRQGYFSRQLLLGEGLDRENVKASYQDGVLTITIPVLEAAKPHKVEVAHIGGVVHEVEAALAAG